MSLLTVRETQCPTCIYRPSSGFDVERLEAEIADPAAPGFFCSFRVCHQHHFGGQLLDVGDPNRVCRGFWIRHKDKFTLGQVAQRLDRVSFSDDGEMAI